MFCVCFVGLGRCHESSVALLVLDMFDMLLGIAHERRQIKFYPGYVLSKIGVKIGSVVDLQKSD